jgi:hypothetical protein
MSTIVAPRTAPPEVKGFFDERTSSIQYVVSDPSTRLCAIVDPVLDFDERSGAQNRNRHPKKLSIQRVQPIGSLEEARLGLAR